MNLQPLFLWGVLAMSPAVSPSALADSKPPVEPASPPAAATLGHPVKRDALCVTYGAVTEDAAGRFSINDPEVRAVSRQGIARTAELSFTVLGPSAETKLLGSGQMRRQFGLKLRAQNGCNLVYVMWRWEPKNELVISVKSNPGMQNHGQCGTHGYQNIVPLHSSPIPTLKAGEPHRLRASLSGNGDGLEVFVDGVSVWSGALGPKALAFDGPVGIRTDNVRLLADLFQSAEVGGASPATLCLPSKGSE
jgi:hypothetical protein